MGGIYDPYTLYDDLFCDIDTVIKTPDDVVSQEENKVMSGIYDPYTLYDDLFCDIDTVIKTPDDVVSQEGNKGNISTMTNVDETTTDAGLIHKYDREM
jgi:hypothetical protein